MSHVPRPSIASLAAARGELERLLDTARESAERARHGNADARAYATALLRQAERVLSILELHDAAQLARDMSLVTSDAQRFQSAGAALAAAFRVITRYPAYVCERGEARPELLRPETATLRSTNGQEPLSEASFLLDASFPDCRCPRQTAPAAVHTDLPRRLRHLYQLGLLAVVRRRFQPIHIHMMRRASDRMLNLCGGGDAGERWWLLGGVLEGFANGTLQATLERTRMLRAGDGWLRTHVNTPEQRDAALGAQERRTLLALVARAGAGQRIAEIRALHDLALTLPDDEALARERRRLLGEPDVDVTQTIVLTQNEFVTIRRALGTVTVESGADAGVLDEVEAALRRAVQVLTEGGQSHAATELGTWCTRIEHCGETATEMSVQSLQQLAETVIEVEVLLSGLAKKHGIEVAPATVALTGDTLAEARSLVLTHARERLESVKHELASAIDAGGVQQQAALIRHELLAMRGALLMLGYRDVAAIATRALELSCRDDAPTAEKEGGTHDEDLADVLIGLEYCIASLQVGDEPDRRILDLARASTPQHPEGVSDGTRRIRMC